MALRFRYHLLSSPQPVLSLGGRWVRPRPIIPTTVIGPTDSRVVQALLDTAADDTVFPESLAALLGLDLQNAPGGRAVGVGQVPVAIRFAEVRLRLYPGS